MNHIRYQTMSSRLSLLLIIALTLTLSACQSISPLLAPQVDTEGERQAQSLERAGNYNRAAQQYVELAASTRGGQRARLYVKAASAFLKNDQLDLAIENFAKVDREQLDKTQQVEAAIVDAKINLAQSQPDQALLAVDNYSLPSLSSAQQKAILKVRIEAYQFTENWLEKANSHIKIADLLAESQQEQNQQDLWQALMKLTPQALDLFNPGMAPAIDSGWFSLAYIVKSYQTRPETLVVALEDWQRSYPNHPADPSVYRATYSHGAQLPQQLNNIAVLLPQIGPYANAAEAIKQGILAAHYAAGSTAQLHFIEVRTDTITGFNNVWQAYQEASSVNADIIIGPLDKKSIQTLADGNELATPVLALNRLPHQQQKNNLFQFGLAPEDDAISAANYALQQGYQRAAILAPNAQWGQRVSSAFLDYWISQGGTVLSQATYNEADNDFSDLITPLMGLEASDRRYQSLKQTIGRSAEFEPRRRQDLDFLFLIARPLKARQLVPQLRFHRSGKLPIIATSHAYSGYPNAQQDIDLNGMVLTDIPWVFSSLANDDQAYLALQSSPNEMFNSLIRLYALGADAYRLSSQLNSLSSSNISSLQGATGTLSVNEAGYIERKLQAARFRDGLINTLGPAANTSLQ